MTATSQGLSEVVREIVLSDIEDEWMGPFESSALWVRMQEQGSTLWLDTGDIEAISELWCAEMTGLTTNNSLLNAEVQKGTYDELVREAAERISQASPELDEQGLIREIAFVLNARHGQRLVRRFGADVSVELHTDLANHAESSIAYGRRYHAIDPDHFVVKIPLTPAGLVAAGALSREGVRVNFTLGFSARQNVIIAMVGQPAYCNVFLGRLNQVAKENGLGDGLGVGERAVTVSQDAVQQIRSQHEISTRQIAASLRSGEQVRDLAGIDVLTMPPDAAREMLAATEPDELSTPMPRREFVPEWSDAKRALQMRVDVLWDVSEAVLRGAEALASQFTQLTADEIQTALAQIGVGDLFPKWTHEDIEQASSDGRIPDLEQWEQRLADGAIGLDALMTLHALGHFTADQRKMDERIRDHLR